MAEKSVEIQAREYVYDVKNCASEFGQSTLEGWEFSLVTDEEKTKDSEKLLSHNSGAPCTRCFTRTIQGSKIKINFAFAKY